MKLNEMVQGTPIQTQRSMRGDNWRGLTSCKAGKVIPLAYHPILREDAIRRGEIAVSVRMSETVHPLINAVNVRVYAHLIPWSAFERFDGMDDFNRAYSKVEKGGANPTPMFPGVTYKSSHEFWKTLGIHAPEDSNVNSMPLEAYNLMVNWRRAARSKHISQRALLANTLARAFWSHPILYDIVPDYELALLDGEVPLGINMDALPPESLLPVRGLSTFSDNVWATDTEGTVINTSTSGGMEVPRQTSPRQDGIHVAGTMTGSGNEKRMAPEIYAVLPDMFEEMRTNGLSLSLSNIELAKQTVAFARLRQNYQGIDEDHLVDLLMDGVRVPPESLRQPILLGRGSGVISMTERYATDGENLDMSRTTGATTVSLRVRAPAVNTGGVVVISAEITPEPLFERMGDQFLMTTDPDQLPQFLRDYLDPKKVEMVENKIVDVLHDEPDGLFGYRGLNRGWDRDFTRAGGKFMRRPDDPFVEDRQRFWVVESNNPSLTEDFYLVSSDLKYTPFADQQADPFEVLTISHMQIEGQTVFGKALHEDTGDYQKIIDRTQGNEEEE